jgi:hypothetical protein
LGSFFLYFLGFFSLSLVFIFFVLFGLFFSLFFGLLFVIFGIYLFFVLFGLFFSLFFGLLFVIFDIYLFLFWSQGLSAYYGFCCRFEALAFYGMISRVIALNLWQY